MILRRLQEEPSLPGISHVIVDEAHERTADGDFLLMALRTLLRTRADLRVILMSATLDAALFTSYFEGAAQLHIPGRTFEVLPLYLEDAIELTKHAVTPSAPWARKAANAPSGGRRGGKGGGMGGGGKGGGAKGGGGGEGGGGEGGGGEGGDSGGGGGGGVRRDEPAEGEMDYDALRRRYPKHSAETIHALATLDHDAIDYELLAESVTAVVRAGPAKLRALARRFHGADGAKEEEAEEELEEEAEVEERRIDVSDGGAYTQAEFEEFYGRPLEWAMAPPAKAAKAAKAVKPGCARRSRRGAASEPGEGGATADGEGDGGAVLIFLPGLKEIESAIAQLQQQPMLDSAEQQKWILPLHSTLSAEEQMRVFARPPAGLIKIVVATNIAETSITIDDISYVIDTGRMKENRYDPQRRLEALVEDCGSRANLKQRRGRAGRVRQGVAIHLITSRRFEILPAQQTPELQRTPLDRVVLRAKKLYPGVRPRAERGGGGGGRLMPQHIQPSPFAHVPSPLPHVPWAFAGLLPGFCRAFAGLLPTDARPLARSPARPLAPVPYSQGRRGSSLGAPRAALRVCHPLGHADARLTGGPHGARQGTGARRGASGGRAGAAHRHHRRRRLHAGRLLPLLWDWRAMGDGTARTGGRGRRRRLRALGGRRGRRRGGWRRATRVAHGARPPLGLPPGRR